MTSRVPAWLRVLRRPWAAGMAAGVALGMLVAPTSGKVLRHRLAGVVRAARSRPGDTPPETVSETPPGDDPNQER
jgi:hypothetical protein